MKVQRDIFQLYFIMGSQNTKKNPVDILEQAIKGGITCFQFREKGNDAKKGLDRINLGLNLRKLCRENNIPFIVNDDVELAIKLDADGIHVGQDDIAIDELRKIVPSHYMIGLSTSTIEESLEAERLNVDYIGVGPVYKTTTKDDALQPIGLKGLQKIRKETTIPIVAIGGINETNAQAVVKHGADGIALISAISQAKNPEETSKHLRKVFNNKKTS